MPQSIPPGIAAIEASRIREVSLCTRGIDNNIPLWFGESDQPTADFICKAGIAGIDQGLTLYSPNSGIDVLRHTITEYMQGLHNKPFDVERVTVTGSGMQGVMLTYQALVSPGDKVVIVGPVWPNIENAARIVGANVVTFNLTRDPDNLCWQLDTDALIHTLGTDSKVLVVNSPNNPTGWMASAEQLQVLLDHCRRHGIWFVADDVYNRLALDQDRAPSVLDMADPDERVVSINSFSKAWSMTGWRLGWITAPGFLLDTYAKLTEYNISCPPAFIQMAGVTAMRDGESFIADQLAQLRQSRDMVTQGLAACPRVSFSPPQATFYAFFSLEGENDSLKLAKRIVREAHVGLAPGSAFGSGGEGFLRLCFACSKDKLGQALERLVPVFS